MNALQDKVVIITGASRGIGLELAKKILEQGAKVSICARDVLGISEKFFSNDDVFIKRCDISDARQVREFIRESYVKFNNIDVVINNAAIGIFKKVENYGVDDWKQVIDINLNGSFYICHEAISFLQKKRTSPKGYIFNIGSVSHNTMVNESSAYSSSKAAMKIFSDHLYNELREESILVTYLAAGSVNTSFSMRNKDNTAWKITPGEISDIIISIINIGYNNPHCCISYLELKTNSPIKIEVFKE